MDYGRLRAAALRDGEDEEAVTVDTRALIDKVLARYSGEWTTLRELIQNAADAQATTVKIKWETLPSIHIPSPATTDRSEILKHVLTNHTLRRLVVQNNGQPFTKTDWGRLKRIAEGNPDETKIGAFGVGFYSVFADCEEPFVSSGSEAMAFYWKGNALFTRRLQLPADQCTSDTAFVLDYRNATTTLPNLLSVGQFLATSLTFVALEHIEFWIDDYKVLSLHKKSSPSAQVTLSRDVDTTTKERLMKIQSVERASAQIDATYMSAIGWKPQATATTKASESYGMSSGADMPSLKSFFSRLTVGSASSKSNKAAREEKAAQEAISEDITAVSTSSIFLRVTTAAIKTSVGQSFAAELERATKKPPPKITKLSILTSSYDEAQASDNSGSSGAISKAIDVFASVLPTKKPGGRIFIGFPTTQTTGAGLHISAPSVIPTVEREAIDLNARWVRTWNIEMLRAAGIMTRIAFCHEMEELQKKVIRSSETSSGGITEKVIVQHMPEAKHILDAFTFGDSTPSSHVSDIIEEAFWLSYKKPFIEVYSSRGVLPSSQVRLDSGELAKFVSGIPIIPPELKESRFIEKLINLEVLITITVEDVRDELGGKPLNKEQLGYFIQWAGKKAASGDLSPASRDGLLDVAVAIVSEDGGAQGDIIALGNIRNYLSPNKIPAGLPIPPTTLPFEFTSKLAAKELQALGWDALEIVPWLRFLIDTGSRRSEDQNLTKSPKFAVQVLTVLSKNWDNLSQSSKNTVVATLQIHTVMPTKLGMRKPAESFFPSVKLFDDLPTIEGCSSLKDKFLSAIGVRKTLDLDTIFKRLLNPSAEDEGAKSKWSHVELIKYLASVRADIPSDDLRKLKESRICPAEVVPSGETSKQGASQLYKVSELFEPKPALRNLNVRIIQWPAGGLRPGSPEGRFLASLGIRPYPSVPELVEMMASPDTKLRDEAMNYFIAYHHTNGYATFNIAATDKAFLPLHGNPKQLVSPSGCITNESASVLGFNILKRELHAHANKFGVNTDPPIVECVNRLLKKPPTTQREATTLFEYFATRMNELGDSVITKLRDAPIVPVARAKRSSKFASADSASDVHLTPRQCYLGSSMLYGDIFDFVDFGSAANAFLFRCGSKTEPTKLEIAHRAADEPAKLLSALQSSEKYLNLLRTLAEDISVLKKDKDLWKKMKTSPFLLAFKEISAGSKEKEVDTEEDEAPIRHYQLATPQQIVILDDYISYRLFKEYLICAPEEDVLETFYMALGSPTLANTIEEDLKIGPHSSKQDGALWLRKHVLERSKLFVHEYARHSRDAIKHDAKWLEKNLAVQAVRSVALRRSLRGHGHQTHTEKRSAASKKAHGGWVLYVASENSRPDMYQVGQAVCQLILNRPSQQAYFFFEPFLKLDLLDLRARGYNVDRILRAKAAEARIAEEERRKALDAEQARIREREQEFRQQTRAATAGATDPSTAAAAISREHSRTPPRGRMPGEFGSPDDDSPPTRPPRLPIPAVPQPKQGGGLFSNLSRRLFESLSADQADNRRPDPGDPAPEPVKLPPAESSSSNTRSEQDTSRVTSPAVIQQNLLNAIQSTRSHDSSQLFAPPTTQDVKEEAEYCDENAGHDLDFVAETSNGTRVFVSRPDSTDASQFLATQYRTINAFAGILRAVAEVYAIQPSALHIFYNETGSAIAFNSGGSLFCNFRFFLQLHAHHFAAPAPGAASGSSGGSGDGRADAAVWWWVVLAHELAHNIVKPHNSAHSFYTESFIQQYYGRMMRTAYQIAASAAPPAAPSPAAQVQGQIQSQVQGQAQSQVRGQVQGQVQSQVQQGQRAAHAPSRPSQSTATPSEAPPPYWA